MKFEDLKKMAGAHPVELSDAQLEQATGGFYIGAMEWIEVDGVLYRGCKGCGEARSSENTGPCPVCGAN